MDEQRRSAEEQTQVVKSLKAGLGRLSGGDLTFRLTEFPGAYQQIRDDFNIAIARLRETIQSVGIRPARSPAPRPRFRQHDGSVAAHRGAGREPGGDLGLDGEECPRP